jgi:hypothetical protein
VKNQLPVAKERLEGLLKDCPVLKVQLSEAHILCLQWRLVQVYSRASGNALLLAKSFDLTEPCRTDLSEKITLLGPEFTPWYNECLR